jgi:hypothetical protein
MRRPLLVTAELAALTAAYLSRIVPRGQVDADQLIDAYSHPIATKETP